VLTQTPLISARAARTVALLLAAVVAGCGTTTSPQATPAGAPTATPMPTGAPTAPPLPAQSAFSATSAVALPADGGSVALPSAGGYGGTLALPTPSSAPANATLAETIASGASAPAAGVPALSIARAAAAARRTQASTPISVLLYVELAFSASVTLPDAPGFAFSVPSGLPSANYYLALYDPTRPSLGWQLGFEGPAALGTNAFTFAPPASASPFSFAANVPEYFAVYAVSPALAAPTPAPSIAPVPAATPAPFTVAPASVALLAAGQTASATIGDPTGYAGAYAVTSSNPAVATASISGTTITVTAVAAGTATIGVADAQARTASIAVGVTTTTLPVQ